MYIIIKSFPDNHREIDSRPFDELDDAQDAMYAEIDKIARSAKGNKGTKGYRDGTVNDKDGCWIVDFDIYYARNI